MLTMALRAVYISRIVALSATTFIERESSMRSLLLTVLLASASVVSFAADSASVTGKWKVHSSIAGNESDTECALAQAGNDLSGTCKTDRREGRKVHRQGRRREGQLVV